MFEQIKELITLKSKAVNYGHVQFIGGGIVLVLSFITKENFPEISITTLSIIAMAAGVITYLIRLKTFLPLSVVNEKQSTAPKEG